MLYLMLICMGNCHFYYFIFCLSRQFCDCSFVYQLMWVIFATKLIYCLVYISIIYVGHSCYFSLILPFNRDHSCYFALVYHMTWVILVISFLNLSFCRGHSCYLTVIYHLIWVILVMSVSFIIGHGSFLLV